ncbi:exodeoxyribonuclease VII large subunit [Leptolyngbya boryana CZ1]|jgi:exodeoxyribonuclease VII large subunit|uniref:Exodeoxyribonuclease 7 large subunit n=2 Tax=Leptolyngbya boryana TaxID=1184 RepID=A0A1Z4JLN4_LEPBY|nr:MULTISPECIES: exodeoxyribonuclease VII large subunit [Leptolyngbya]BAY57538.1 XseA protein [Leptolyngbya boryana NIES-2135]MBD2368526.1 exodeoxyribonuclease VII large subunit [Leptolyngbya sp. FACHB-161]MBD2375213.1 exodeoxyribonuclease VII large subunit [Leptolyngbya sp. FACHB-238]MBD2399632.1 exodeoxyribonuclease VII large subunit [Leptolyngbya sp. FACHB-239]MBD2405837.1 exodeoxyribonuclease VII large subunit [Leptolyngbya sp. FACHB-402]
MTSKLPNLLVPDSALSVADLTAYIQSLIEQDDQLRQVWLTGEVSSATRYRSGLFFTLQDPAAKAVIQCVVWSSQLHKLTTIPAPGEQLIVLGRVHVQPHRGSYQLVVWQALPGGEGLRALRSRQLKDRLEAEGLFDVDRKRPIPSHPQTVAVVTSPQAAAWGDIQRTLKRRYPGLRVLFSPALVQGDQAPSAIVNAIRRVERDGRADVLILSRGGGAIEDMACFNDENVVRAIANCSIPVIAGIGHQRDESLADLAADVFAHTPTAAAEQAVPCLADLYEIHLERSEALSSAMARYMMIAQDRLVGLRDRMSRLKLDRALKQEMQVVSWLQQRLIHSTQRRFQSASQHCQMLQEKLTTLDPQAVLQRGYAVVRSAKGIVRSAKDVKIGDNLTIQLGQGEIEVYVNSVLNTSAQPNPEQL